MEMEKVNDQVGGPLSSNLDVALEKERKIPSFLIVLAFIYATINLITQIFPLSSYLGAGIVVSVIARLCSVAWSVLLILGTFGKKKAFAIGCFIFAFAQILHTTASLISLSILESQHGIDLVSRNLASSVISAILTISPYVLIGLYVLLKGKGITYLFKLIVAIVYASLGSISGLGNILSLITNTPSLDVQYRVILFILSFIKNQILYIILIFYSPYKKEKKPLEESNIS